MNAFRRLTLAAALGTALLASAGAMAQSIVVASTTSTEQSGLFSYLLPKVWHVSLFSGAMSSVLAILIWAYCGAWGVLLGAVWTVRVDEA